MDYWNMSEQINICLEGGEGISFSRVNSISSRLPTALDFEKDIVKIELPYAYFSGQEHGIHPLKTAFGAEPDGIITKIPDEMTEVVYHGITILKCGTTEIDSTMELLVVNAGVVGYWDDANLIISTTEKYKPFIQKIKGFIKPHKAKLALENTRGGPNLILSKIE